MLIDIGYELQFRAPAPVAMTLGLYAHPSRQADLVEPDVIYTDPPVPLDSFVDAFGNRLARVVVPAGDVRFHSHNQVRDSGRPDAVPTTDDEQRQRLVSELPTDVLQYLMPSRYCEVELLQDRAWDLFGQYPAGWARAKAVVDWVHDWVTFGYPYARATKTAYDVFHERRGVCRDFQHLCVALHRCLNIPARYVTGYLGDIGLPFNPAPMDFSAWHEVYLGGRWWSVDGRHNVPRIGRILMATGRDAVDVALTTQFGPATLTKFEVTTNEAK